MAVVEAKKNDFEQGWGQCLAELIAAQKLNNNEQPVYGIVTDGKSWEFAQLEDKLLIKNIRSFTIDNLSELFGALSFIFKKIDEGNS